MNLAREHAEAAVGAAEAVAIGVAREHAEAAAGAAQAVAIGVAREHAEAAAGAAQAVAIGVAREHAEAAAGAVGNELRDLFDGEISALRSQVVRDVRRLERVLNSRLAASGDAGLAQSHRADTGISSLLYADLEDRFRGSAEEIHERQSIHVGAVREALRRCDARSVLDLGSGRGEWLQLLKEEGVDAQGVDGNAIFTAECAERGLKVASGDVLDHVKALPDAEFAAVTMFHIVEHLPLDYLATLLAECHRVLDPEGVLIVETPNCASLSVAASTFWIDPTHPRPLHPEVLRFLIERAGFTSVETVLLHEIGPEGTTESELEGFPDIVRALARAVFGHGDLAFVARI